MIDPRRCTFALMIFLAPGIANAQGPADTVAEPPEESATQKDERLGWWRDSRYGMFIHWGLYSAAAGEWEGKPVDGLSSWTQRTAKIPVDEYSILRKQFDASKFDADAYAKLAQDAGMKYIILVSKHHEGFCLWKSESTDDDIASTPYSGDLVKELAEACQRRGIRFGVYYSILDWKHPDYVPRLPWDKRSHEPDFDNYVSFMKGQLKELLDIAPSIDVMWFDGEWDDSWTHERGKELYDYVRLLKPSILVNNRVDKGRAGMDGLTRGENLQATLVRPNSKSLPRAYPGSIGKPA